MKRSCSISGGMEHIAQPPGSSVDAPCASNLCSPPASDQRSPLPPGLPAPMQDDYIDDTMDAENYESSFDEWGESMPGACCI